jgi:hypothetical protein
LPQRPKKKTAILKKLIESPSTSKVLSGQGLTLTPACKKKLQVADAMVDSFSSHLSCFVRHIEVFSKCELTVLLQNWTSYDIICMLLFSVLSTTAFYLRYTFFHWIYHSICYLKFFLAGRGQS